MNRPDEFRRDDIESLAVGRRFEDLTGEERELVLRECGSRDVYDRMRGALLLTRRELSVAEPGPVPRPDIRSELHAALRSRAARTPSRFSAGLVRIFAHRVPAYQVAVAAMTIAGLVIMFGRNGRMAVPRDRIVYVRTTDTAARNNELEATLENVVDSLRDELRRSRESDNKAVRLASATSISPRRARQEGGAPERVPMAQRQVIMSSNRVLEHQPGRNQYVGLDNLPGLEIQKRGRTLAEDSSLSSFTATSDGRRF
ncbi:MAG: hypothetical protein JWQ98_1157 [Chlorobi bacterium]|nr:hypothetical protein [Chlorobiota bacterium]